MAQIRISLDSPGTQADGIWVTVCPVGPPIFENIEDALVRAFVGFHRNLVNDRLVLAERLSTPK